MMSRKRNIFIGLGAAIAAIVVVVVVIVVLVVVVDEGEPTAEDTRASVEEIINQVETDRARINSATGVTTEASFAPAQIGQVLQSGDRVKTFPGSEARVDIVIRHFTRIMRSTPNTIWRLGQFAVDQEAIVELEQGKIFLLDDGKRKDSRPIKIVTPAGTASPRGTIMSVEFNPETGEAEVKCFRGTCELENEQGTQILRDEEKSTVTKETAPTPPKVLERPDRDVFKVIPEVVEREVEVPTPEAPVPTDTPGPTPTNVPPTLNQS